MRTETFAHEVYGSFVSYFFVAHISGSADIIL